MSTAEKTIKQMRLTTFCKEFDIPKNTALQWIHSKGFPAYKMGKCWYIDLPEFFAWRDREHLKSYRYA